MIVPLPSSVVTAAGPSAVPILNRFSSGWGWLLIPELVFAAAAVPPMLARTTAKAPSRSANRRTRRETSVRPAAAPRQVPLSVPALPIARL